MLSDEEKRDWRVESGEGGKLVAKTVITSTAVETTLSCCLRHILLQNVLSNGVASFAHKCA